MSYALTVNFHMHKDSEVGHGLDPVSVTRDPIVLRDSSQGQQRYIKQNGMMRLEIFVQASMDKLCVTADSIGCCDLYSEPSTNAELCHEMQ